MPDGGGRAFGLPFNLPFIDAIAAARERKVELPADYYGPRSAAARRAATTISNLTLLDQVQRVVDALTTALARGDTFEAWQRSIESENLQLPVHRLETIFRTNIQTAYSAGHWKAFEESKNRRPYLMWSAINDARVRPSHLAMDGYIAHIDDPIWNVWHPPAGYNCRCSQISLTESQARARGYGRQARPTAKPDPGFEGTGKPDEVERGAKKARAKAVPKAAPPIARALLDREAAQAIPTPQGTPVSRALTLPRGVAGAQVRAAMALIDRLHGDGVLPHLPVKMSTAKGYFGYYRDGDRIAVSSRGDHHGLTFAHEVGHFLDHRGWGGPGWSSATQDAAQAWRDAIAASPSIVGLKAMPGGGLRNYYLRTHEAWARSYAQWVAVRSGDPALIAQVAHIRTVGGARGLSQWAADEFEPIARAIDNLFDTLGWRRKGG